MGTVLALERHVRNYFQLEESTGLPRHQLVYLISQLREFDKDKDGLVTCEEWEKFTASR